MYAFSGLCIGIFIVFALDHFAFDRTLCVSTCYTIDGEQYFPRFSDHISSPHRPRCTRIVGSGSYKLRGPSLTLQDPGEKIKINVLELQH